MNTGIPSHLDHFSGQRFLNAGTNMLHFPSITRITIFAKVRALSLHIVRDGYNWHDEAGSSLRERTLPNSFESGPLPDLRDHREIQNVTCRTRRNFTSDLYLEGISFLHHHALSKTRYREATPISNISPDLFVATISVETKERSDIFESFGRSGIINVLSWY